ncbi:hypothetical protein K7472_15700 [Streptomyces sp. PTM05]|uniref:DNA-directed RNA polymerase specialized sigma24 family protein n=1 Tax=Streptantibioticus parmotrematis TaxID=2873249 RepID=A0ABS7QSY5_9ACTN|nr:hypothetical protein [Streptantibioticus parmotrematis]
MDTQATSAPAADVTSLPPVEVDDAEAALVEHYPRLVRIAYLTLSARLGRHRRVLLAHRVAQRSLPRGRRVPEVVEAGTDPAYAVVRLATLRGALARADRVDGWRRWARSAGNAVPVPPRVIGLRLFPRAGGSEELALDRALARLDAPARAAFALRGVEGLDEESTARLLASAGVAAPRRAVRDAAMSGVNASLLVSGEFDPCVLQARPTDLVRRRQHVRAGVGAALAVVVAAALLGVPGSDGGTEASGPPGSAQAALAQALDPASLLRADATAWQRADRLDFASWPARGDRTGDQALLGRALSAWGRPGASVHVSATAGTPSTPPAAPPRLLFAGDVDGAAIVLLYDGVRLVRYAEPLDGGSGTALDFARVDGALGASASAVVLARSDGNASYLTAPWISGVSLRDLLSPSAAPQAIHRAADGVTDPVPSAQAATDANCGTAGATWPAIRLTPRAGVPGLAPFVLTDLGDLAPAHLTYATGRGAVPAEATSADATAAWAHSACRLASVRGEGVRTVNTWAFADQPLPDGAGTAQWLCTRADDWSGDDHVLVQFLPPGSAPDTPAAVSASARSTAACGPLQPGVLSGVLWKARDGRWYLLGAGSPEVASLTATGGPRSTSPTRTLVVPARQTTQAELTGRLTTGGTLDALK